MNRDDILRMAREQGLPETEVEGVFRVNSDDLGRMLAAERERIIAANAPEIERINAHIKELEQARLEEREACARVCEEDAAMIGVLCADAIRARGATPAA